MKTLKDLKAAVAKATHMRLVSSNKPHKHLGVVRKIHLANTVGFALEDPASRDPSYLQWPKVCHLTVSYLQPTRFKVSVAGLELLYELITEVPPCATSL